MAIECRAPSRLPAAMDCWIVMSVRSRSAGCPCANGEANRVRPAKNTTANNPGATSPDTRTALLSYTVPGTAQGDRLRPQSAVTNINLLILSLQVLKTGDILTEIVYIRLVRNGVSKLYIVNVFSELGRVLNAT